MGKNESVFAPSLPLGNNGRFAEGGNAVCQRRMGAKKRPERAAPKKGLYDAQGRSRRRYSRRRNAIVVPTQLLKGADQSVRVSHHPCAGLVGGILPLAGESELQEHGGKRGQNHHQQTEQAASGTTYSFGTGKFAFAARRSMTAYSLGNCSRVTGLAPLDKSAILSEKK